MSECKNHEFCEDENGHARGWVLGSSDTDSRGLNNQIMRCDACDIFASDEAAARHVVALAIRRY
jgi:hypothetical protein